VIVQPVALRTEAVPALMRVTRISLIELLDGAGASPDQRQALAESLRSGGMVAARVLATAADGTNVLELAAQRVSIRLAAAHAPGDWLWISVEPDTGAAASAAEVKLSRPALLLQDIQKSTLNQMLTEVNATRPLAPSEAEPQVLAHALQHAVRRSGLFYESHLAGWVHGRIALDEIREEPQARIAHTAYAGAGEVRAAVHPQLEPLVRQQLDTLERQSIAWRGMLWPEQQAAMVIAGDPQIAADETPRAWRVHLEINLPALGPLTIDMALNGRRLDLRLQGEGAATQVLRAERAALAQALCAHDLEVNPIRVAASA
jgi:hypothetical protein